MFRFIQTKELITTVLLTAAVLCAASVLNISSVNAGDQEAEKSKSESDNIMALQSTWSDKFGEGDLDWIVNQHAADALQLPPGADIIQGKEALAAAWKGMIDTEGLELSWQSSAVFVSASNDMAYDYGLGKLKSPDGSVQNVKYVVVWTRIDGEWKIALDMFNISGPATE